MIFCNPKNQTNHTRISHNHNIEDHARISHNPKDHKDNVKFKLHVIVIYILWSLNLTRIMGYVYMYGCINTILLSFTRTNSSIS
jgi:hypothetical protein